MELSIILPVYNNEETIEKCLNSLMEQDFDKSFEIIIVDDGSTDNSVKLIERYVGNNVKLFRIKHSERVEAKKRGLIEASGIYVYIAEADAYYSKNCMSECHKIATVGRSIVLPRRKVWGPLKSWAQRCYDFYFRAREYGGFTGYDELKGAWFYPRGLLSRLYHDSNFSVFDDVEVAREARTLGYEIRLSNGEWWHKEPSSFRELFTRNMFYGKRLSAHFKRYPKDIIRFVASILLSFGLIVSFISIFLKNIFLIPFTLLLFIFLLRNKIFVEYGIKKKRYFDLITFLTLYRYTGLIATFVGLTLPQRSAK